MQLSTRVEDVGEVKWVLRWALDRDIPTPVRSTAQETLMAYRGHHWPAAKAMAVLRNQFGGTRSTASSTTTARDARENAAEAV